MWEHVMYMRRGEKNSKMADFKDRALMLTKGHSVEGAPGLIDQVYRDEIKPRLWPRKFERLNITFSRDMRFGWCQQRLWNWRKQLPR
jgi:hypothetical protein